MAHSILPICASKAQRDLNKSLKKIKHTCRLTSQKQKKKRARFKNKKVLNLKEYNRIRKQPIYPYLHRRNRTRTNFYSIPKFQISEDLWKRQLYKEYKKEHRCIEYKPLSEQMDRLKEYLSARQKYRPTIIDTSMPYKNYFEDIILRHTETKVSRMLPSHQQLMDRLLPPMKIINTKAIDVSYLTAFGLNAIKDTTHPDPLEVFYDRAFDSTNSPLLLSSRGVCKICGCTKTSACYHPDYGNCWWVNNQKDLCSHCADISHENSIAAMMLSEPENGED